MASKCANNNKLTAEIIQLNQPSCHTTKFAWIYCKRVGKSPPTGNPEASRGQVRVALDSYATGNGGSREGHVFNLGHGMSPDMSPDHVGVLVEAVHAYSKR